MNPIPDGTGVNFGQPTDYLPPLSAWSGASERLIVAASDPWITPAEATGLTDTPRYDVAIAYLKRLCTAQPSLLRMEEFGRTAEGRLLYLVLASKLASKNPASLRTDGRPIVLIQAGLHPGEIEGKDAGLMLLRDIAVRGKADVLDQVHLLFLPVFNPDGHERISRWNRPNQRGPVHMGWRTTAQNLNLNRDYTKVDAPEMQALLVLLNAYQPVLYIDVHASDGIDHAYDLTYAFHGYDGTFAYSPASGAWLDQTFRPAVDAALRANDHVPGPYVSAINNRDLSQGVMRHHYGPRYSTGYADLAHIPTVLIETHALKPHRQRVLATYVFLETALRKAGEHAAALNEAVAADRRLRPVSLPFNWGLPGRSTTIRYEGIAHEDYFSSASGRQEVRWLGIPQRHEHLLLVDDRAEVQIPRPKAYWVPVTKSEVISRLMMHGLAMEMLNAPRTVQVELLRLIDPVATAEPFEGRHRVEIKAVVAEPRAETYAAGSVRVSTDQPLGDLAVALLEPQSNDSFLAWGFFSEILQRTEYIEAYVIAPLAERMLATDRATRDEFEAKLKQDAAFASDAEARLRWFYQRSPFYDQRYLLYPVGIER